jgi:hypothetical protein
MLCFFFKKILCIERAFEKIDTSGHWMAANSVYAFTCATDGQ